MTMTLFGETRGEKPKIRVEHSLDIVSEGSNDLTQMARNEGVKKGTVSALAGETLYHPLVPFELVRAIGAYINVGLRGDIGGFLDVNVVPLEDRLKVLRRDFQAGIDSNKQLLSEALAQYDKEHSLDVSGGGNSNAGGNNSTTDEKSQIQGPIIGQFGAYKIYDPNKIKVVGVVDIVGFLAPDTVERVSAGSEGSFRDVEWVRYRFDRSVGRINSLILDELANQTIDAGYGLNLNSIIHLANNRGVEGHTGLTNFLNFLSARAGVAKVFGEGFVGGDTAYLSRNDFDVVKSGEWKEDSFVKDGGERHSDRTYTLRWKTDTATKAKQFGGRKVAGAINPAISTAGLGNLVTAVSFVRQPKPWNWGGGDAVGFREGRNIADIVNAKLTDSNSIPINNIDSSSFLTKGKAYCYIVAR